MAGHHKFSDLEADMSPERQERIRFLTRQEQRIMHEALRRSLRIIDDGTDVPSPDNSQT